MMENFFDLVINYADNNFQEGELSVQLSNFKGLVKLLVKNGIVIDEENAVNLYFSNDKLRTMVDALMSSEKTKKVCNNRNIRCLMLVNIDRNEKDNDLDNDSSSDRSDSDVFFKDCPDLDTIKIYLSELPSQILTPEKEYELFTRVANGEEQAKKDILYYNLRLVVSVAKKYNDCGLPFEDIIQEGNMGLMEAIEKFDVTKGYKFSTYASIWIRQHILKAIADKSRIIRIPYYLNDIIVKIRKARSIWKKTHSSDITPSELSELTGVSEERIRLCLCVMNDAISLETPVNSENYDKNDYNENRLSLHEVLVEEESQYDDIELKDYLEKFMVAVNNASSLKERELYVVKARAGFFNDREMTLEDIGKEIGVTRERVRQIEIRALGKLRHDENVSSFRY